MAAQLESTFEVITHIHQLAEHEKALLAQELHDELGVCLISAVLDLALLAPRITSSSGDSQQKFRRVQESLSSAIAITRRITEQLRPTLLDNVGLFAALRWQLRNVCERSKIKCKDDLPATELQLTSRASITLFRSTQEALIVGLERPGVTEIELVGKMEDAALHIHVRGDGCNLLDAPQPLCHVTLNSIRHRVRVLGGVVNVDHPPNGGIVVGVSTPIANVVSPARDRGW
ncbi:MAG: histidine kinase [Pseudomonadota bacterium]|nr:histidine kinase [Pseudomonadota bacterium]